MKKLLKIYGLKNQEAYFDMCINLYRIDKEREARIVYNAMPRNNRKTMLNYLLCNYEANKKVFSFFLSVL